MRDPEGDDTQNRDGEKEREGLVTSEKGRCARGANVGLPLRGSLSGFGGN